MRISKVHLLGLAVALTGVAAQDAAANDVSVSTATTTPLSTSSPDGVSAGDVTVANGGSITVDVGEAAITMDSNNDVTIDNGGSLASSDDDDTRGVVITGTRTGDVTNNGTISLVETYVLEDEDDDGNLDGVFAEGENRVGILLDSGATLTGDILHAGPMTIEGIDSAGIRIDGVLNGDLTTNGGISVVGDGSRGVEINGAINGDVLINNGVTTTGEGNIGVLVNAAIDGSFDIGRTISATGYHSTIRPSTDEGIAALDPEDLLQGGSAVDIRYSIADGVTVRGVGVEDDEDDDGDGETEEEGDDDDDITGSIIAYGGAPALSISPDATTPVDLVLGATTSGFGVVNRGGIGAAGIYDGVDATGVRIAGRGGSTVTVTGGIRNDGTMNAEAVEADSYGLSIGDDAIVPRLINRKTISSRSFSETTQNAYGLYIDVGASLPTLTNNGQITGEMVGGAGTAYGIVDRSNTLATIVNTGTIRASIGAIDDEAITGAAYAIDLSASTIAVTITQDPDARFNDDDDADDDAATRPAVAIIGGVRLGSGADTINLNAGSITGDIQFGAGADTFRIDDGATFTGRLSDSNNALSIDVVDGAMNLQGGTSNITTAHFGGDADLGVLLTTAPADSTLIVSSGTITFDEGAVITPIAPEGLPTSLTRVFLTANGGLVGADNVTRPITDGTAPFLYNLSIIEAPGDANSLAASFQIKTATQLGLNANEALALDPILAGIRANGAAAEALGALRTAFDFDDAYEDLMPSYSSAAAEIAATAIQQQQSASSNRLAAARLNTVRGKSLWAQEIGYGLNREPADDNGVEFRGHGFGFAAGVDGPLNGGPLVGLSASFITSNVEEPGRPDGEISASFGQLNAYAGTSLGPIDLDFVAGGGAGRMKSRRFIEIGDDFSELSEAEWSAYEGHGAVRASMPMRMGWFVMTPQAALTYVVLQEDGYTEEGGGTGIDYEVDSATSQRLWGDAAVQFSGRFGGDQRGDTIYAPHLLLGWRANLIDESAERTFRVASGGSDFTLTDEAYGDGGALAGFGITAGNGFSTFTLAYEGEFGDEITRHSLNASIRIHF